MERHAEDIAVDALFAIAHILGSAHLLRCHLLCFQILFIHINHLMLIVYHLAERFPFWGLDCIILPPIHLCEKQIPQIVRMAADLDMAVLEEGAVTASECLCQKILSLSGNIRNLPKISEELH